MTGFLLLLAAAPQGEPALTASKITEAQAIERAKLKAAALGVKVYGDPMAESAQRGREEIWRVNLSAALSRLPSTTMELSARDGHLVGFSDGGYSVTDPLPGWSPRIARPSARSRTIAVGRKIGVPSTWVVGRSSFDGTGKNRWPARAEVTFEERPQGYRYLVDGNRATVTLNPRTGALSSYTLMDTYAVQRTTVRLRADQASRIAREWRETNRSDPRAKVEGPIRLGWAVLDPTTSVARLVYDVPFLIETHWVDANTGKVVGGRRTRDIKPISR